jgi:hypothetical protein
VGLRRRGLQLAVEAETQVHQRLHDNVSRAG